MIIQPLITVFLQESIDIQQCRRIMCANKRGFYNHDSNEKWKNRDAIIINLALQSEDSIICRVDVTLAQTSVVGKVRTHKTCAGITF